MLSYEEDCTGWWKSVKDIIIIVGCSTEEWNELTDNVNAFFMFRLNGEY